MMMTGAGEELKRIEGHKLRIRNDLHELERITDWLSRLGREGLITMEALRHFQLACDEWITNVISYGYTDTEEHWIELRLKDAGNEWVLTVEDEGLPYNPLIRGAVDVRQSLDDKPIGGLGIHFINQMMNELFYERIEERNVFTMIKHKAEEE
jgi:serine/threonine-protein kinase RsbW